MKRYTVKNIADMYLISKAKVFYIIKQLETNGDKLEYIQQGNKKLYSADAVRRIVEYMEQHPTQAVNTPKQADKEPEPNITQENTQAVNDALYREIIASKDAEIKTLKECIETLTAELDARKDEHAQLIETIKRTQEVELAKTIESKTDKPKLLERIFKRKQTNVNE